MNCKPFFDTNQKLGLTAQTVQGNYPVFILRVTDMKSVIKLTIPVGRRMQKQSVRKLAFTAVAATALTFSASALHAEGLDDIFAVSADGNRIAQASQVRINNIANETDDLLQDYKRILKEIEGLRVYNAQLERQIAKQIVKMGELRTSIEEVTLIERQITPLMMRMMASLTEFINHDVPFLEGERHGRIERLNEMMDNPDVSPSEKFRNVFEAYQIENDYGRTIEAYEGTTEIEGSIRDVNFLRIGRVGLYYQTKDGSVSGMWNSKAKSWIELDDDFGNAITEGIRIANNQATPNLINLPVIAPE